MIHLEPNEMHGSTFRCLFHIDKVQMWKIIEHAYLLVKDLPNGEITISVAEVQQYIDSLKQDVDFLMHFQNRRTEYEWRRIQQESAEREAHSPRQAERGWLWDEEDDAEISA